MIDYYHPRSTVVVVVRGDRYTGQTGTVVSTLNDAGDMVHRVRFNGATNGTADYYAHELTDARTAHMNFKEEA
jgi:methionyl-tRNA formyltransferase